MHTYENQKEPIQTNLSWLSFLSYKWQAILSLTISFYIKKILEELNQGLPNYQKAHQLKKNRGSVMHFTLHHWAIPSTGHTLPTDFWNDSISGFNNT